MRVVLAAAVLAGALTVLSAQAASACTLGLGVDCDVHIGSDGIHSVDHSQDFTDPARYAQAPPPEKVREWRTTNWYLYPRDAQATADWWSNLARGGRHNPNFRARAKAEQAVIAQARVNDTARDTSRIGVVAQPHPQQQQPQAAGGGFGHDPNWRPSWGPK